MCCGASTLRALTLVAGAQLLSSAQKDLKEFRLLRLKLQRPYNTEGATFLADKDPAFVRRLVFLSFRGPPYGLEFDTRTVGQGSVVHRRCVVLTRHHSVVTRRW